MAVVVVVVVVKSSFCTYSPSFQRGEGEKEVELLVVTRREEEKNRSKR